MAEKEDKIHKDQCDGCSQECPGEHRIGKALAEEAISKMSAQSEREPVVNSDWFSVEDVDDFLSSCVERDVDPLEVVSHIAKENGIKLSEDAPKDESQRKIWVFLKAVIRKLVVVLVSNLADQCGFGIGTLLNAALGIIDEKHKKESPRKTEDKSEDRGCGSCAARPVCRIFRYSFSW